MSVFDRFRLTGKRLFITGGSRGLGREMALAIADEAKKDGISYAGHLPEAISALEAAHAGQKSFEHLYGISLACSTREAAMQAQPSSDATEWRRRRPVTSA